MKTEKTNKYDYQVLHELISELRMSPPDWSKTKFIIKYRDIFTLIDIAMADLVIPEVKVYSCTEDECAAGISYLLDIQFAKYHMKVTDIPAQSENAQLKFRELLHLFMKRADIKASLLQNVTIKSKKSAISALEWLQ